MLESQFFDVHTHTQFAAFDDDRDAVIQRALEGGVWMVNVGTQRDTSLNAVKTAERYKSGVYAAIGLHPIHTDKSYHDEKELGGDNTFTSRGEEFDQGYYKTLAIHPRVVAIGECGLDYYRLSESTKTKQERAFLVQIQLAHEVQKPLMIHCRNAFPDLISVLQAHVSELPAERGIIHFFSGTQDDAKKLMTLGFSFSFGGVVTFTADYDDVVRYISLDRIVLETDAPYITPVPYRGKRNEPLYVKEVAKKIAVLKNLTVEQVAGATTANAKRIFHI